MFNLDELYNQAWEGELSEEAVPDLLAQLRSPTASNNDKATIIKILGEHGNPKYAPDIEPSLEAKDEWLVWKTLNVLTHWDDNGRYAAPLLKFMRGVDWDEDGIVRGIAISCAGDWLRRNKNSEVLAKLIHIFEDVTEDEDERAWAYRALARAMGLSYNEIPDIFKEVDLTTDVDPKVVKRAKERLKSQPPAEKANSD